MNLSGCTLSNVDNAPCFHCGLPSLKTFSYIINDRLEPFCCFGCQAVASAIIDGGLADFYAFRDAQSKRVHEESINFSQYDITAVQAELTHDLPSGEKEAVLSVDGISCAACAWLIEKHLLAMSGVSHVSVNATNYTCRVVWRNETVSLSAILQALFSIGFKARPYQESQQSSQRKFQQKSLLMRVGVAGIGMMQVGMYAIALHAGGLQGMDSSWESFFRWVSFLVATPVVLYSASPFFSNAWRALKHGHVSMDLPVSMAIGLAYCASVWATLRQTGDVYFDSISMFTFFLLVGRYFELRARNSRAFSLENFSQLLPLTVDKVTPSGITVVPYAQLAVGDVLVVSGGACIPCDGVLEHGCGSVDESLLTGESEPVKKETGDEVWAGSLNTETPFNVTVQSIGKNTRLASVERLTQKALLEKPKTLSLVDRIASRFIVFVIACAGIAFVGWSMVDASKALWVALSVLVVTCPCALSLATPAALTAGALRMKNLGVLVASASFIENLASVTQVVFDKTGTLTQGQLGLKEVRSLTGIPQRCLEQIAASLEMKVSHPIAHAFDSLSQEVLAVERHCVYPAEGVEAYIDGKCYRLGHQAFADADGTTPYPGVGCWQLLSCEGQPLAWFLFEDTLREDAHVTVEQLSDAGLGVTILSGDREENVQPVADQLHVSEFYAQQSPEQKLTYLTNLQRDAKTVLMVGDGINDVPGLSGASVSLAMGASTQIAQTNADAVLLNNKLRTIPQGICFAKAVTKTIRQNLYWAFCYNIVVLPAAMLGMVPPYLAAIGMSLSSLVVVFNALRLRSWQAPELGRRKK